MYTYMWAPDKQKITEENGAHLRSESRGGGCAWVGWGGCSFITTKEVKLHWGPYIENPNR